jgi:hypothetical protein
MHEDVISAEIEPASNQAQQAARALQQLGFRVLHIGLTISVQAPRALWEQTFGVSFETRRKTTISGVEDSEVIYYKPTTDVVSIPATFRDIIAGVYFVEPPEFHSPP